MKKIERLLIDYLGPIDLFSTPFTFTFNKSEHYSNKKSVTCSLITMLLGLLIGVYSILRYFQFRTPIVTVQQEYRDTSKDYYLSTKEHSFGFSFWRFDADFQGAIPFKLTGENSVFGVKVNTFPVSEPIQGKPNPIKFCNEVGENPVIDEENSQSLFSVPSEFDVSKITCTHLESPIVLGGDYLQDGYRQFGAGSLTVDNCSFADFCQGGAPIYTLAINYRNALPDVMAHTGFTSSDRVKTFDFDLRKDYNVVFTYRLNKFVSDDNLLFDFLNRRENENLSLISLEIEPKETKADLKKTSIDIRFEMDELINSYSRSQYKLDNVMANIDAMIKMLLIVSQSIIHILNFGEFDYKIAKTLRSKGIISLSSSQKIKKTQFDTFSLVFCKSRVQRNNPIYAELIDKFEELKELDFVYGRLHKKKTEDPSSKSSFKSSIKAESETNRDIQSNNFILRE